MRTGAESEALPLFFGGEEAATATLRLSAAQAKAVQNQEDTNFIRSSTANAQTQFTQCGRCHALARFEPANDWLRLLL
jgi:hypothetical protein